MENSTPGSSVATVLRAGQRVDVGVGQVGAVVGGGGAGLHRDLHAGPGAELVGVHPGDQARGRGPAASTARASSAPNAPRSQNTSTHLACGAQASSIGPQTRST